ncbi:uncharacterized protein LOC121853907 [Homarus americanus]|uniref:Uncharacterized protein n=1 Tax=Homarus americanus TaxID=6706 RepID=A0A8J5MM66_HOMAM|nr:uncharacterized protein LOC121853907 [Homarus americanus]KAG7156307.1 hypothetical protein Hamer_G006033 [Homarus americanus]
MMKVATMCVVAAALFAVTLANPSATLASPTFPEVDSSKILQKRDYKTPGAPADSYSSEADNGFYYYYHPVEADGKKDEKCSIDKLLVPLVLITIFVGISTFSGLLSPILGKFTDLPTITIPELVIPKARDLAASAVSYIPWDSVDRVTLAVTEAVESEQCLPRLMCESGKYANGRSTALSLLEIFTPRRLQAHMKIFKDSALKNTDCTIYKCRHADGNKKA